MCRTAVNDATCGDQNSTKRYELPKNKPCVYLVNFSGLNDVFTLKLLEDCVYANNVTSLSPAPVAVRPGVEAYGSASSVNVNFDEARLVYGFVVESSAATTFTFVYKQNVGASSKSLQNFFASPDR